MKNTDNPRSLAVKSLIRFERDAKFSNLEVNSAIDSANLQGVDKALFTRLVYGVIERKITLDYIISQYSDRPADKIDLETKTALRLGVYQLLYADRVPDFAAVSETVNTAPKRSRGYVNGLLRSFIRKNKSYTLPEEDPADKSGNSLIRAMSARYSASESLCRIFVDSYGKNTAKEILECFEQSSRVCLRVNTLKISVPDALERLSAGGAVKVSHVSDDIIVSDKLTDAARRGIDEGLWFVQDESSRACSKVLGAVAGQTVADVCAAPGGKTFSIAIDMENTGEVYSFDLHENKLSLIRSGAGKLGLSKIHTAKRDARTPDEKLVGKCDAVLCDAPCSGLGIFAKKPDIRYKSDEDIKRLPDIQSAVLKGASEYVKKGGVLVYSTCTLNKKENEEVAIKFLDENKNFKSEDFKISGACESADGMATIFPHIAGCDGFFIAKFRRI